MCVCFFNSVTEASVEPSFTKITSAVYVFCSEKNVFKAAVKAGIFSSSFKKGMMTEIFTSYVLVWIDLAGLPAILLPEGTDRMTLLPIPMSVLSPTSIPLIIRVPLPI